MSNHHPRSRISTCLLLVILVVCVFVISVSLSILMVLELKKCGPSSVNKYSDQLYLSLVILSIDSLTQPVDISKKSH
jgi:hypothetical protein